MSKKVYRCRIDEETRMLYNKKGGGTSGCFEKVAPSAAALVLCKQKRPALAAG
jgi:hypothetical protein